MHESELPERDKRELPGDAEDSMDWLEELAGDTGALWEDPPSEQPVSSKAPSENSGYDGLSEWSGPQSRSEATEPESEPIPEWLIPHLETTELPVEFEESERPELTTEQDTMVSAKIPSIPDDDVGDGNEENSEEESAEDLSWLDRIASGEGTAIEEIPTMRWDEPDAEPENESSRTEMPAAEEEEEVPEDADEAMAWLEQLATRQGAPSDEMTMADAQAAVEIPEVEDDVDAVNVTAIPEDPDQAVAWLEQLAAQQGAPDEELTSYQEEVYDLVEETAPDIDDELESAMEELEGVAMPEDSDEALAWLGELTNVEVAEVETEDVMPEAGVVEEPPTPAVEHDVVAARAEAEILFAEQQSESAEEEADALETEAALGEQSDIDSSVHFEAVEAVTDVAGEVGRADVVEESSGVEEPGDIELEAVEEEAEVLAPGDIGEDDLAVEADEDLDWLDSLDERDAVSWLESESAASEAEAVEDEELVEAIAVESVDDVEFGETHEPLPEIDQEIVATGLDAERLELARSAVESEDWSAVANEYEALLGSGQGLPFLISELQTSVANHEQQPILKRLLGDAFVRNGQLEEAVDIYRKALDQL